MYLRMLLHEFKTNSSNNFNAYMKTIYIHIFAQWTKDTIETNTLCQWKYKSCKPKINEHIKIYIQQK